MTFYTEFFEESLVDRLSSCCQYIMSSDPLEKRLLAHIKIHVNDPSN